MIDIGTIKYDKEKHIIKLELSNIIKDNLSKQQSNDLQVAWTKLAELIESPLNKSIRGDKVHGNTNDIRENIGKH